LSRIAEEKVGGGWKKKTSRRTINPQRRKKKAKARPIQGCKNNAFTPRGRGRKKTRSQKDLAESGGNDKMRNKQISWGRKRFQRNVWKKRPSQAKPVVFTKGEAKKPRNTGNKKGYKSRQVGGGKGDPKMKGVPERDKKKKRRRRKWGERNSNSTRKSFKRKKET